MSGNNVKIVLKNSLSKFYKVLIYSNKLEIVAVFLMHLPRFLETLHWPYNLTPTTKKVQKYVKIHSNSSKKLPFWGLWKSYLWFIKKIILFSSYQSFYPVCQMTLMIKVKSNINFKIGKCQNLFFSWIKSWEIIPGLSL